MEKVMFNLYVSKQCMDPTCDEKTLVPDGYDGLVVCPTCDRDFLNALRQGFPGEHDKDTFFEFLEVHGNKQQRIDKLFKECGLQW
jgi:hypothetical protein